MRSTGVFPASAIVLMLSISSRPATAAWPHNPSVNLAVCTASSKQSQPTIVGDGAGGAIIAWLDRGSDRDIYAQHVLASGTVDPAWPVNGRALCTAANDQISPKIVTDGVGGAIVTWQDSRAGNNDVYAQHVLASGAVDPAWPLNGRALCTAPDNQNAPTIVADGSGGAIVTWFDFRTSTSDDIYAQHVLGSGVVAWAADGFALCTASGNQQYPAIVADGTGGAIVTWMDPRTGDEVIYAQHVTASGVDPGWPVDGRALSSIASQTIPMIVDDGAGGAIVAWAGNLLASGVRAQHVLATGTLDGAWPADGCRVSTDSTGNTPMITSDGAGGAIVAWEYVSGITSDIYAQHVLASGAVDPAWPSAGRPLCIATGFQTTPVLIADGRHAAIVAWSDNRRDNLDIYAQRVDPFGYLGTTEPSIAAVRDVANDQGGHVNVAWNASWLDTESPYVVDHYAIFRSMIWSEAMTSLRSGSRMLRLGDLEPGPGERAILSTTKNETTYYWEYLATQAAYHFLQGYSYTASTQGDSTANGNPKTAFMVVALNASGTLYWLSVPDSGYSVDNLPPATPGPFTGSYSAGATHLHWDPNLEPDLANYRLYRGTNSGFLPGPGNLIASPTNTDFSDVGAAGSYYKLSAVDLHGNESGFALVTPAGSTGVPGDALPDDLALYAPSPNPSFAAVSLRFVLPSATLVRLALYDAGGRCVRTLVQGVRRAGDHALRWDLRDDAGRGVAAGLYFVRLEAQGRVVVRKVVAAL
jgi:flagellar hook capping protein FlgD